MDNQRLSICHSLVESTNGRSLESLSKGASSSLASTINYRIKNAERQMDTKLQSGCYLSFSLLRSSIVCICGAWSSSGCFGRAPPLVYLVRLI